MQSSKPDILKSLEEVSDITEATMYPDFDGFARLHAHDKPYVAPDAQVYLRRGIAAHQSDNLEEAIKYYDEAITLKPDFVEAHNNRGNAYNNKGDYDCAIADCTKAIALNPDYADAYYNLGVVYDKKGDIDRAFENFTKAIDLKPDSDAYYNLGVAHGKKGNFDRGIDDYTKAIDLKSDFAGAYNNRGEALLHLREWEKAKSDLITAKNMGVDIIAAFRNNYENVADFEGKYGIQLPADIATMLTPESA